MACAVAYARRSRVSSLNRRANPRRAPDRRFLAYLPPPILLALPLPERVAARCEEPVGAPQPPLELMPSCVSAAPIGQHPAIRRSQAKPLVTSKPLAARGRPFASREGPQRGSRKRVQHRYVLREPVLRERTGSYSPTKSAEGTRLLGRKLFSQSAKIAPRETTGSLIGSIRIASSQEKQLGAQSSCERNGSRGHDTDVTPRKIVRMNRIIA